MYVGHRLVHLEVAVRAGAARVHDALGDALVVEVGDLLTEVEVLHERRPALAGLERIVGVRDAHALIRRENLTVGPRLIRRAIAVLWSARPWTRRSVSVVQRRWLPCLPLYRPRRPDAATACFDAPSRARAAISFCILAPTDSNRSGPQDCSIRPKICPSSSIT